MTPKRDFEVTGNIFSFTLNLLLLTYTGYYYDNADTVLIRLETDSLYF